MVQEADCRFEIVQGVYVDGAAVMLNQCTGDSWRFDSGWDGSKYTRPYSWSKIERTVDGGGQ